MKKLTAIVFSFFYLLVTTGVVITIHYCEGKVEHIEVVAEHEKCCCPVAEQAESCCEDKVLFFQFDKEQLANEYVRIPIEIPCFELTGEQSGILTRDAASDPKTGSPVDSPPSKSPKPLWLVNCTFTFYG